MGMILETDHLFVRPLRQVLCREPATAAGPAVENIIDSLHYHRSINHSGNKGRKAVEFRFLLPLDRYARRLLEKSLSQGKDEGQGICSSGVL